MRRLFTAGLALTFSLGLAACGGGEQAAQQQAATDTAPATTEEGGADKADGGELTMPGWMEVDENAGTVTMDVVAGSSNANNAWNFNGYHSGNARVVVPQGSKVTINFTNEDQLSPHSLGIDEKTSDFPPTFQSVKPVFSGAVTSGATSMSEATQAGESETITFTAGKAGEYSMICYLPGHATAGMWIYFKVSSEGKTGLQEL